MVKLAVIGAGQLGSRHLQALALIDRPASIEVVDPVPASLENAKNLIGQVDAIGNIIGVRYLNDISELDHELDLAVIATNADVRRVVVEEFLTKKKVRYLILEKVLFQKREDFSLANSLLELKGVRAWVNCPRRMWPFYRELKDKMKGAQRVEYKVSGSLIGIGCNGIHFLDHLAHLTGQSDFSLLTDRLDDQIMPSKRPQFKEFTGTLYGLLSGSTPISITSYPSGSAPILVQITSDTLCCIADESKGRAWISEKAGGWTWQDCSFTVPYQSRLTHLAVQQILDTGHCDLTPYKESWRLHLPLIEALSSHLRRHTAEDIDLCPIT